MNKNVVSLVTGIMTLIASTSAFADCDSRYLDYIQKIEAEIERIQPEETKKHNQMFSTLTTGALVGGTGGFELAVGAGAAGSGAVASTAGGAGFIAGFYLALSLAEDHFKFEIPELSERLLVAKYAYDFIREAKIGQGTALQLSMKRVWNEVGPDVSLHELADTINELNSRDDFCQGDALDPAKTILNKAIVALKNR